MNAQTKISEVKTACDLAGGQASLARLLGVSVPTVNQWIHGVRPVPPKWASAMELLFPNHVNRRRFRPDDWHLIWPELAQSEAA